MRQCQWRYGYFRYGARHLKRLFEEWWWPLKVLPASGPRHGMEHPSLPILYVICEMSRLSERVLGKCPGLSSLQRSSSGIGLLRQGSPCVPGAGGCLT